MTKIVHSPHPILSEQDKREYTFEFKDGQTTIADVLVACGVDLEFKPVLLTVNGIPVHIDQWDKTPVTPTDYITIRTLVHGGGGSNPVAAILTIALSIVAPGIGTALASSLGISSPIGVALVKGVVMVAGKMLINAIFPPTLPSPQSRAENEAESPTYSISGSGNRARKYGVVPLVIGTHKMFPDLDSTPYTEFEGNDQYLYQTFNFGWVGDDMEITDLKIGDTLIDSFDGVEYEISAGKTGTLTLFPANVDSISGAALTDDNDWISRTTSLNTDKIGIDIQGLLFRVADDGSLQDKSCVIHMQYKPTGSGTWLDFDDGSHADGKYTITSKSRKTIRYTFTKEVTGGQYDVRVKKLTADPTNDRVTMDMQFSSLRSYQNDSADYTGQKRMAVKIRASGQLSGTISALNAIVSQKIPTWNGSSWVSAATSNPAWQYLFLARGIRNAAGKLLCGVGLSDSQIDIAELQDWAAWCDYHSLGCNFVYDGQMVTAEMLSIPARIGRGTWSWATGKLGVVWDEENKPITQMISMENIVQGSFEVSYVTQNLADEINVSFINPNLGWQPDTVRVAVNGATNPVNPVNVDITGLTDKDQAGKEANLIAARQFYHRRRVSLDMDMEGLVSNRGDVVSLSHDLTSWAQSARVTSGTTTVLTLDNPVQFTAGETHYVGVRYPNGTIYLRQCVDASGEQSTITLTTPLPSAPDDDVENEPHDYLIQFDIQATPGKKMKIVSVTPMGEYAEKVRLDLIDEVPDYYSAANDAYNYSIPQTYHQALASVSNLQITEDLLGIEGPVRVNLVWDMQHAIGAKVRIQEWGEDFIDYGTVYGNGYSFLVYDATTITVELTPVAIVETKENGGVLTQQYSIKNLGSLPSDAPIIIPNVSGLELKEAEGANRDEFSKLDAVFTWRSNTPSSIEIGEEQFGGDSGTNSQFFKDYQFEVWANGTRVFVDWTRNTTYKFRYDDNVLAAGGPHRTFTVKVYQRGELNTISERPAVLTVSNPAPPVPSFSLTSGIKQMWVKIDPLNERDLAGYYVCTGTSTGFDPTDPSSVAFKGGAGVVSLSGNAGDTVYVKVAAYDQYDDDITTLTFSPEQSITILDETIRTEYGIDGITFQQNDPTANSVSWTAGSGYDKDTGATTSIGAGNAAWTSGVLYVYWVPGNTTLSTSTNLADVVAGVPLASYRGGTDLTVGDSGDAYLDGGRILAQTVGANQLVSDSAVITGSAQIADAIIDTAHVSSLNASKLTAGSITGDKLTSGSAVITGSAQIANAIIGTSHVSSLDATKLTAGTITADKYAELRNSLLHTDSDSLDSSHPMIIHFPILSEMTAINSIKASFKIMPFRSYSTTASAASAPTHYHKLPFSNGSRSTTYYLYFDPSSGLFKSAAGAPISLTTNDGHTHTYSIGATVGNDVYFYNGNFCYWTTTASPYGDVSVESTTTNGHSHRLIVYNITGASPPSGSMRVFHETVSSVPTVYVNGAGGLYDLGALAEPHTHDLLFGIYEETNSPTITVSASDNGGTSYSSVGSYTTDQFELDVTSYFTSTGWKALKFASTARCRLQVIVEMKLDITA